MTIRNFFHRYCWLVFLFPIAAEACTKSGESPLFQCEAMQGKKYIELCDHDLEGESAYLVYRFGALDDHQREATVELEYPTKTAGSLKHFFAATYGDTHTVRFVIGNYDYIVFSRHRNYAAVAREEKEAENDESAVVEPYEYGVDVRDRKTEKVSTIHCSEKPRFYIYNLKGLVPCDPKTPVGTACVE